MRHCSTCLARGTKRDALYVAQDADGLCWFECEDHHPTDNIAQVTRTQRTSVLEFFATLGIDPSEVGD